MEAANRILSALEVGEKMEMGLCFFCDEHFTLEHQLMHTNIQILVMENDAAEPEQENEYTTLNLNLSTSAPISIKNPIPSDIAPFLYDSLKSDNKNTQKSHIEVNPAADPSQISFSCDSTSFSFDLKMSGNDDSNKSQSEDNSAEKCVSSLPNGTMRTLTVFEQWVFPLRASLNPTVTPLPEPPDGVADRVTEPVDEQKNMDPTPILVSDHSADAPPCCEIHRLFGCCVGNLDPFSIGCRGAASSFSVAVPLLDTSPYDPGPFASPLPDLVKLGFPESKMDDISLCGEHLPDGECAEVQKDEGNSLTGLDYQHVHSNRRKEFLAPTVGIDFESCDVAYNHYICYIKEVEFRVRVRGSWFKQNSKETGLHHSENSKIQYSPIHYREPIFYTKIVKESHMIDDNGNSFEFSLIGFKCMGAGDKSKKNQNQSCWVWQKEKLYVLNFVDKDHGNHKLHSVNEFVVDWEHNMHRVLQDLTCLLQISTRTEDLIVDILQLCTHIGIQLREVFKDPYEIHLKIAECFAPLELYTSSSMQVSIPLAISSVVLVDALFHLANLSGLSRQLVIIVDFFVEATNHWSIVISNVDILGVRELIFLASNLTVSLFLLLPNLAKGRRLLEPEMLIETLINELKRHGTWCMYGIFLHATSACDQHTHNPVIIYPKLCVSCYGSGSVFYKCKSELQLAMPSLPLSSLQKQSYSTHINKTLRECTLLVVLIGESVGVWVGLCTASYFLLLMVVQVATIRKRATVVDERLALWCYGLGLVTTKELEQLIANYMAMITLDVAAYHGEIGATAGQVALLLRLVISQMFHVLQLRLCSLLPHRSYKTAVACLVELPDFVSIWHRKMIDRGRDRALLKWKTLPLKHGTSKYSSLRTRMF